MKVYLDPILYFVYLVQTTRAVCPSNERMDKCKSPCQPTCKNPNPAQCYFVTCSPGCVCYSGFIRDESSGNCVEPNQCPSDCLEDETENKLSTCEPTCPFSNKTLPYLVEIKKCICKSGLVRDEKTGTCIPLQDCPGECGIHEEISECVNPVCRKTCQNRNILRKCPEFCERGCICKAGYIWDEYSDKCVLEKDCPPDCDENQIYQECSDVHCRITCKNFGHPVACPKICQPGCSCKSDYIWDDRQSKCVKKSQCSKECGLNEEWSYCVNSCKETCHSTGVRFCPMLCRSGCTCRNGYIWDEHVQACVRRWQCSKVCGENQEWCDYVPGDIPTCQSLLRPLYRYRYAPTFVSLKSGCVCTTGYIFDELANKCITLDECLNGKSTTTTANTAYPSMSTTTNIVSTGLSTTATSIQYSTTNKAGSSMPTSSKPSSSNPISTTGTVVKHSTSTSVSSEPSSSNPISRYRWYSSELFNKYI